MGGSMVVVVGVGGVSANHQISCQQAGEKVKLPESSAITLMLVFFFILSFYSRRTKEKIKRERERQKKQLVGWPVSRNNARLSHSCRQTWRPEDG